MAALQAQSRQRASEIMRRRRELLPRWNRDENLSPEGVPPQHIPGLTATLGLREPFNFEGRNPPETYVGGFNRSSETATDRQHRSVDWYMTHVRPPRVTARLAFGHLPNDVIEHIMGYADESAPYIRAAMDIRNPRATEGPVTADDASVGVQRLPGLAISNETYQYVTAPGQNELLRELPFYDHSSDGRVTRGGWPFLALRDVHGSHYAWDHVMRQQLQQVQEDARERAAAQGVHLRSQYAEPVDYGAVD